MGVDGAGERPPWQASQVLHALTSRRVVRSFTDRPVDDDLVEPMLEAALAAPSASNKQAWAFVVVRDRRMLKLIRAFSPGVIEPPPMIVAACFDRSRAVGGGGEWDEGMLCVAMAVQNLLLAAHCQGLGGCPVGSFRAGPVRGLLRLPEHLEPLLLVPIGHPARALSSTIRRCQDEVVSYESWGQ